VHGFIGNSSDVYMRGMPCLVLQGFSGCIAVMWHAFVRF